MSLETNATKYKANKYDKWFDKQMDTNTPRLSQKLQETELEIEQREQAMELERLREIDRRRRGDDTGEAEAELSQPFDPAMSILNMIGAIGNVIADPIGTFITVEDSPVESAVSSDEEQEREVQRQT